MVRALGYLCFQLLAVAVTVATAGTLYMCLEFLSLSVCLSAQFQVVAQDKAVAEVGSRAVLPCSLSPALSPVGLEVRWFRNLFHSTVFLLRDGQEEKEQQISEYRGRASLQAGPQTGDLTLILRNVRLSDVGTYHCFVENRSSLMYEEASTQLRIVGIGSLPNLTVSLKDSSIRLAFSSPGWFPEPEMRWVRRDGAALTADSRTSVNESNGLFRLQSSVVLKDVSDGNIYCAVRHPVTGKESGVYLKIAEDMFPRVSLWLYAFVCAVILLLAVVVGAIIFIRNLQRETGHLSETVDYLSSRLDWRRAVMNPAQISISPETAHPQLSVSEDCLTLKNQPPPVDPYPNASRFETERCCLGQPSFSGGLNYWEVELGAGLEWAVGVASPEVRRTGAAYMFSPQEHIWCISRFVDVFHILDEAERPLRVQEGALERVGIYLKLVEPREVSFYDPGTWRLLHTFHLVSRENMSFQPFFWLGNRGGEIRLLRGYGHEVEEQEEGVEEENLL
ncbi:butyrophilin subfamily 1 member A1-like [Pelodytes ibericus]